MRSKLCFFKTLRTVSLDTVSMISSSIIFSVSRRMVHRVYPSGDLPQASVMILASMSPVMIGGLVVLVRLNFKVCSIPLLV